MSEERKGGCWSDCEGYLCLCCRVVCVWCLVLEDFAWRCCFPVTTRQPLFLKTTVSQVPKVTESRDAFDCFHVAGENYFLNFERKNVRHNISTYINIAQIPPASPTTLLLVEDIHIYIYIYLAANIICTNLLNASTVPKLIALNLRS